LILAGTRRTFDILRAINGEDSYGRGRVFHPPRFGGFLG
jgi:hypothetical protein